MDVKAKQLLELLQQRAPAGTPLATCLADWVGGKDMLVVMDDVWDAR